MKLTPPKGPPSQPQLSLGEEPNAPWKPRDRVGPYTLLNRLAFGGMAEIWLALQSGVQGFERLVVVKKMADILSTDPDFVDMFLDEARIAVQLSHPNIVQVHDLGQHAGSYYIAMEYLNGENLAYVVRAGNQAGLPLPVSYAVRIVSLAAEGLSYAHTKRGSDGQPLHIVHRDVSPQNLQITYDGVVKIVDFGIAKAANRATHTVGSQLKGKMAYMSPEQARGHPVDGRADVFSLGVVLYETIAGVRLFHLDDSFAALAAITGDDPIAPPSARNAEVPPELDQIVLKALSRPVEGRYQSAREFQNALETWLHRQAQVPGTDELSAYMTGLFQQRMEHRNQMIEAARQGESAVIALTPAMVSSTPASMPGATDPRTILARRERVSKPSSRWKGWAIGGSLIALAVLGGLFAARYTFRAQVEPAALPGLPALPTAPPALSIETVPTGAEVTIDGKARGRAPLEATDLTLGDHVVVATWEGHPPVQRITTLQAGPVQVVLELPASTPPTDAKPKEVVYGKLTLVTKPWCHVFMGSRSLGDTPLIQVPLPAGRHVLRMVNDDQNLKSSIEVEIVPGKLTVKKLSL